MKSKKELSCDWWFPPIVRVKERALEKMKTYTDLAPEVYREISESQGNIDLLNYPGIFETFELHGFTCGFRHSGITEDCFIEKQVAYQSYVHITPASISRASLKAKSINPDYKIDGRFHEHPKPYTLLPSHKDLRDIEVVLAHSAAIQTVENHEVEYANMFIVDGHKRNPYAMVASICPYGIFDKRTAILQVLPGGPEIDKGLMKEEIRKNVTVPKISIGKIDREILEKEIRENISVPLIELSNGDKRKIEDFIIEIGLEKIIKYLHVRK